MTSGTNEINADPLTWILWRGRANAIREDLFVNSNQIREVHNKMLWPE